MQLTYTIRLFNIRNLVVIWAVHTFSISGNCISWALHTFFSIYHWYLTIWTIFACSIVYNLIFLTNCSKKEMIWTMIFLLTDRSKWKGSLTIFLTNIPFLSSDLIQKCYIIMCNTTYQHNMFVQH